MQGHSQSARLDQKPGHPPMLDHMPYHPEAEPLLQDHTEAVRQANLAATRNTGRAVDSATLIAKKAAP